ncbi:hypothetical protein [Paraferrimonas sedimenticola]|uniref:Lipoprotein n=1 Tax=Paraferrimonas sedimenticola TaxID=375674 RepID=A0AA37VYS3_9GAMM|nr:hypothetical protein [Paraferrimonas sedimenticola]GLP96849.1 hypothetical protein GCM10007895_21550 [Paraferrimonas sedimenticola]
MKPQSTILLILCGVTMLLLNGCATRTPTIAHTHIGHALEGWHDTPNQAGLLVTAEQAAIVAHDAAKAAAKSDNDLATIKRNVQIVIDATIRNEPVPKGADKYAVKNALIDAISHIDFAANSPDASANVKALSKMLAEKLPQIVERCDLIGVLGQDILLAKSTNEAALLTQELVNLTRDNLYGAEASGSAFGLAQVRSEIESTIAVEDPAYSTVDRWYLFNLIQMPSGEWLFKQSDKGHSGDHRGY